MRTFAVLFTFLATGAASAAPDPYSTIAEQRTAQATGSVTSEQITRGYLDRITRVDPMLNSVLAVNPQALARARALDAERRAGKVRGPLHGIALLVKDNIETADLATTAGSLALIANHGGVDAPLVKRLTDAGVVVLGKANLSEWANFRSTKSISGWSAVDGLVRNPYALNRTACGSSSGSAAAVAAGLATAAIGTETDGSITCPAAMTGIVGLKPTLGLVSRSRVVPISPEQDTAGPMARTVGGAAALLEVIAGSDPADPSTREADARKGGYVAALGREGLRGVRIGAWNPYRGRSPETDAVFERALLTLRAQGAIVVRIKGVQIADLERIGPLEGAALQTEFRVALDAYLASTPPTVTARSLQELIVFNNGEPRETVLFRQEIFESAIKAPAITDPAYLQTRATARRLATDALDRMLAGDRLAAIVAPTAGPAEILDDRSGFRWLGSASLLPAVSGYPHLTVPMGLAGGMPVGLSFLGPAWSEARLLRLGYAFEQATRARREPDFRGSVVVPPVRAMVNGGS